MIRRLLMVAYIFVSVLLPAACGRRTSYEEWESSELAKGIRHDSLFLGLRFGMTRQQFFDHCQKLHEQGLLTEGGLQSGAISARYTLSNGLPHVAILNFYPDFYKDTIYKMETDLKYDAWAPWNKQLFADSLKKALVGLFEQWYGKGFVKLTDPHRGDVWLKIDGNRRIVISGINDIYVRAIFTDLTVDKRIPAGDAGRPSATPEQHTK
jgi:hypothetical protein